VLHSWSTDNYPILLWYIYLCNWTQHISVW